MMATVLINKTLVRLPTALFISDDGKSLFGLGAERDFEIKKTFGVYQLRWSIPKGFSAFHIKVLVALLSNARPISRSHDQSLFTDSTASVYEAANAVWDRLSGNSAQFTGTIRQLLLASGISADNPDNYRKLRAFLLHQTIADDGQSKIDNCISVRISGGGIKDSSPNPILNSIEHEDGTVTVKLNWLLTAAAFETFEQIESKDQRSMIGYVSLPSADIKNLMPNEEISAATYLWLAYFTRGWTIEKIVPLAQLEILVWGGGKRSGKSKLKNIGRIVDVLKAVTQDSYLVEGIGQSATVTVRARSASKNTRIVEQKSSQSESAEFQRFWVAYPQCARKTEQQRQRAAAIWAKESLDSDIDMIVKDIRRRMGSTGDGDKLWLAKNGQFIHNPTTYLDEKMWVKEIAKPASVGVKPEPVCNTYMAATESLTWWAEAGFTSEVEAQNDGCHKKKHQFFQNGVRIKDIYGNPRPRGEIFSDLTNRITRWMMNFTNEAFSLERDHALRMMRKMPRIDFWSMLQGKVQDKERDELRALLITLPVESATRRAIELEGGV